MRSTSQHSGPRTLPQAGEIVAGRYEVERFIARGGMSHVFAARHTSLGSSLALKVLDPKLLQGVQDAVVRFGREARLSSQLRHPSIVEVFDIGVTEGGLPFIAMELLDGAPLGDLLRSEAPLSWPRARGLILQILDALHVAHSAGAVHRDVKPDNCLVLPGGEHLKLLDFGIAHALHETKVTRTGNVLGTPHYLSPEQARGSTTDARSDVYSAGVVLYEMLTGHCPFEQGTTFEIVGAHIQAPLPPLSSWIDEGQLPAGLPALVERVLAKDPNARPPHAGVFAQEVRALSDTPAPRKIPPSVWGGVAAAFAVGLSIVGLSEPDPRFIGPLFSGVEIGPTSFPEHIVEVGAALRPEDETVSADDVADPDVVVVVDAEPAAPVEPAPVPEDLQPDDATVARAERRRDTARALRSATSSCGASAPPGGALVSVRARVAADGSIHGVEIRPPYAGTLLGRCVAKAIDAANVGEGPRVLFDRRIRVGH